MLQNGDKDWYAWRKSFDLQVRSVWGDLDKLLVEMRDYTEPTRLRRISYAVFCLKKKINPPPIYNSSPFLKHCLPYDLPTPFIPLVIY